MANTNSSETGTTEINDDTKQWGQAMLRAKTALIKPYSKVKKMKLNKFFNSFFLSFSIPKKVFVHDHPMIHILF